MLNAEETSLYSGPLTLNGSNGAVIAASKLQDIGVGDVIRIYANGFSGANKTATVGFQDASGNALFPEEKSFSVYGDFSLIVSTPCLSLLKNGGLKVSGSGCTIQEITIEKDPRTKVLFDGNVDIAYYTPNINIPKFQFYNLKIGDVLKVKTANITSTSKGSFQQWDWGDIKSGYNGFSITGDYSMEVDEGVLKWLQEGVLRIRGCYYTVKRIEMYCPNSGYNVTPGEKRDAPMMFGLNESGGEFAGVYPGIDQTHYGYPDRKDMEYAAKKGFKIIRLPFRWERIERPAGNGKLITTEINKIKQVMGWAEEFGLRVIFDMHNFGRYCTYCNGTSSTDNVYKIIGEGEVTVNAFSNVWRLLANEFKDYKQIWAYEIMNEPYSMLAKTPWFNIAQACIYAIREVDTETPILVDGNEFASASRWTSVSDMLRSLNDPADNLIFTAHSYFDKNSSGEYTESYDNSGANAQTGVTRMKPFVEWCKKYGLRGFIGEYGIPDNDTRWLTVLENALKYLQENNIGGTYWSAGHRWGDYKLAVHPTNNMTKDRPQMSVLEKYLFTKDYTETTIDEIEDDKGIVNVENNIIYNLSGQVVGADYKGIVIANGKKILKI